MKNKKISIIITIFLICIMFFSVSYASITDDVFNDGDAFLGHAGSTSDVVSQSELKDFSNDMYNMIFIIGAVVAVIIGSILGVKFMLSAVEEKAKIKEMLIIYVIGCAVVFGAFTIWEIIVNVLDLI